MRRGFTLLEMLVAAFVLAVGLVGTLTLIANSTRMTKEADDRARALMFARSKMDEILKEPVIQLGTDEGKDVDQTTDYNWQVVVEQTQNPNLYSVTVVATNRITGLSRNVNALRRPDISSPLNADGTAADTTDDGTDTTGAAGTGAGGT
jgi:type IV pilus modification protein PilV